MTKIGPGEMYIPDLIWGAWKGQHFTKRFAGFTFTMTADGKVIDEKS